MAPFIRTTIQLLLSSMHAESPSNSAVNQTAACQHTQSHALDRCPECAIGDWSTSHSMDFLPGLYNARQKDRGANVRACKLDRRN